MDLSDLGGAGGWLSNLIGGGATGDPSTAVPGAVGPTSVGGGPLAPGSSAPTLAGGLQALSAGGPAMQKAMTPAAPAAPQIQMPQTHPQPYAAALAQIMAKLNANKPGAVTPQGTQ